MTSACASPTTTSAPVADRLHALLADTSEVARWQANALAVYKREFSKRAVNDRWDALLRRLVTSDVSQLKRWRKPAPVLYAS